MQKTLTRIAYIDLLKGLAIILMIVGHTFRTQNILFRIIYSFHMPLFAIISGYFFKKKDLEDRIKGIVQRMLLPYIYTWTIIFVIQMIKNWYEGSSLFNNLSRIISSFLFASATNINIAGVQVSHCGPVWFLIALGIATLILNLYVDKKHAYVYTVLIGYIGYSTAQIKDLPFCIQQACILLSFLHVGYYFKNLEILSKKIDATFIFFAGLSASYCFKQGAMHISAVVISGGLMNFIWAIAASFILMKIFEKRTCHLVTFLGRNSLVILCIHTVWCYAKNWRHLTGSFFINVIIEILVPIVGLIALRNILSLKEYIRKFFDIKNEY